MKSMVTIEDFNKLDIRIGKVLSVEKVSGADKLLKFIFDLGEEKRQIIAGMAEFYSEPSILEGKEMPLLLNLEPRMFRGQMSEGMIIAADVDGRPVLLHPEREISPGSIVR
ncbi:MAG: methionine--tRNA ligase [Acidobacteria bacterium]|nr:methionine--tRNA ligase [Acidobacteriota bacterium]